MASRRWRVTLTVALLAVVCTTAVALLSVTLKSAVRGVDHVIAYAVFGLVALVSPIVLAALARRLPAPVHGAARPRSRWLPPLAAVLALSIAIMVLGLSAYRLGSEFVTNSVRHRLESVVTLKGSLVNAFLEDAKDDIRIWSASPQFFRAVDEWRAGGPSDAQAHQRLVDFLWRLSKTSHYVEISLRDADSGALLISTSGDADSADERHAALGASRSDAPVLEDFHTDSIGDRARSLYLGLFGAVTTPGGRRLVVHAGIDPQHELFALIAPLPSDAGSEDALLLRRDGEALTVLNDMRSLREHTAPRHLIIGPPQAIGTALARTSNAFIRGEDDRHQAVMAYSRPVAGTQWTLVAKVDEADVFAELNRISLLIASATFGLLMLGTWWWVESRRHHAQEQRFGIERAQQSERLAELSRRIVSVQERERRRLASELHDRTGANLAAIKLNLQSVSRALPAAAPVVGELMQETGDLLTDTIVSIREFCGDLRPSILDYAGLAQALENSVAQFRRRTGIAAEIDRSAFTGRCAPEVESVLFRIGQEALLNCAKHSSATRVQVRLVGDAQRLTLTIEDNGVGFDPERLGQSDAETGSGVLSMRERAAFAGASLILESAPGRGTRVVVELPGSGGAAAPRSSAG